MSPLGGSKPPCIMCVETLGRIIFIGVYATKEAQTNNPLNSSNYKICGYESSVQSYITHVWS